MIDPNEPRQMVNEFTFDGTAYNNSAHGQMHIYAKNYEEEIYIFQSATMEFKSGQFHGKYTDWLYFKPFGNTYFVDNEGVAHRRIEDSPEEAYFNLDGTVNTALDSDWYKHVDLREDI